MSAAMVLPCSTPTLSNAGPNPHASESEGHAAYAARLKTELKITASFKPPAQEGGPWKVRAKFSQAAGRQLSRRRGVDSTFKGAGPAMSEVGGWASRCLRECDNDSNGSQGGRKRKEVSSQQKTPSPMSEKSFMALLQQPKASQSPAASLLPVVPIGVVPSAATAATTWGTYLQLAVLRM